MRKSGRPRERPTKTKIGRQGRISRLPEGCLEAEEAKGKTNGSFFGSNRAKKPKNRKFKTPYIKLILDSKKWDSDRWDGLEIILGSIPLFFSRHLVEQNVGNIVVVVRDSLKIGLGPKKVNGLAICSKNKFRDYCIRNRIEKLMPQLWNFPPQT